MTIFGEAAFTVSTLDDFTDPLERAIKLVQKLGTESDQANRHLQQLGEGRELGSSAAMDKLIEKFGSIVDLSNKSEVAAKKWGESITGATKEAMQGILDFLELSKDQVAILEHINQLQEDAAGGSGRALPAGPAGPAGRSFEELDLSSASHSFEELDDSASKASKFIQDLIKQINDLDKKLGELRSAARTGNLLPGGQDELKRLDAERQSAEKLLVKVEPLSALFGGPLPASAEKTRKAVSGVLAAMGEFNVRVQNGIQPVGKLAADLTKLAAAQEATARATGDRKIIDPDEAELAVAELEKVIASIAKLEAQLKRGGSSDVLTKQLDTLRTKALNLFKSLGQEVPNTQEGLDDLFKSFGRGGKELSGFDKFLEPINDKLETFGLNVSGISVLLGAGFAGGLTGIIKIGAQAVQALSKLAAAERELARQTTLTFGPSAVAEIEGFAETVAHNFGDSANELQGLENEFGVFGKRLGLLTGELGNFAQGLTQLADLARNVVPGLENISDAQNLIQAAIGGDIQAFRQLGFTTAEINKAAQDQFGLTFDKLDEVQRITLLLTDGMEKLGAAAENVKIDPKKLIVNETIEDLKDALGGVFNFFRDGIVIAIVTLNVAVANATNIIIHTVNAAIHAVNATIDAINAIPVLPDLPNIPTIPTIDTAELFHINEYFDALEGGTKVIKDQTAAVDDLDAAHKRLARDTFLASTENQQQAADAFLNLARAEEDATIRTKESLVARQRAYEDNAKRERDVRFQNQKQVEDANRRLNEAEIQLQRAREDRTQKIHDFTVEHNRKTFDLNRDHARKLEDFVLKEDELQKQQVRNSFDAQEALFEARFKGDEFAEKAASSNLARQRKDAQDAEKDLAREKKRELEDFQLDKSREREDRINELGKLEVETNRQIFDSHARVTEALVERQRATEESINRLQDLEIENTRAIFDAQKNVDNVAREAKRSVDDASKAVDRLALSFHMTTAELKELLNQIEILKNAFPEFDINTFRPAPAPPQFAASGAHAGRGSPFVVGEKGPELFVPDENGTIVPNGFGNGSQVNVTINEANDPEVTLFMIESRVAQGINQ